MFHNIRNVAFCLQLMLLTATAWSADHPEIVLLWPAGAPGAVGEEPLDKPALTVHLPAPEMASGAAVVVCPGGGYGHLAEGHEGRDVAAWLNSHGVAAFVLKYRLAPRYRHPAPLLDAQRAIRTVRAGHEKWKLDPKRIGIMGFSAGGHLASTAGTHFDAGKPDAIDPVDQVSCRPDLQILCYPVISLTSSSTHVGSRNNLLGPNPDPALMELLSNEKQVTKETPPTFLFHTGADTAVPPENSILFYLALRTHGIPAELHIYEPGRHGLGLAPKDEVLSNWPDRCAAWLKLHGFTKKISEKP